MQHAGVRPFGGAVTRFFQQLTLCAGETVFTGVQLARRKFDHHLLHGITVLTLHDQTAIVKKGNHHDGPWVNDKFACRLLAIGQTHGVTKGVQKVAFEQLHVIERVFNQMVAG